MEKKFSYAWTLGIWARSVGLPTSDSLLDLQTSFLYLVQGRASFNSAGDGGAEEPHLGAVVEVALSCFVSSAAREAREGAHPGGSRAGASERGERRLRGGYDRDQEARVPGGMIMF